MGLILEKVLPNAEICGFAVLFTIIAEDTSWIFLKFFIPFFVCFFAVIFESVNFAFDLKIENYKEVMWSNLTLLRFLTLSPITSPQNN